MTVTHAVFTVYLLMLAPASVQAQRSTPPSVVSSDSPISIGDADAIVLCDAETRPVRVLLPSTPHLGQIVDVLKTDATRHACSVDSNGKRINKHALVITHSADIIRLRFTGKKWSKR